MNDIELYCSDCLEVMKTIPNKSIRIKRSFDYLNTEKTQDSTLKNCWILQNAGDTNSLELLQVQIIEDSIDGKKGSNLYEFHKSEFLGCEMSEDSPYLYQQQVRKMFFNKKYSKQLCLEMEGINYGYERGTLVSVLFSEDDPMKIRNIKYYFNYTFCVYLLLPILTCFKYT